MSMNFDKWNPQEEAFFNRDFNSYDRGPGKYISNANYKDEKTVQLHVSNIPPLISEDGLRALFSKAGNVANIWIHKDRGYAFVTMKSLRDAELAIRKLDDFKIEKFKIAVRIAKNDKVKAALMLQKKEEEAFLKELNTDNEDEDWNNDDYTTSSTFDLQPKNLYQNGGDSKSSKKSAPLEEDIIHSVHSLDTSKNGKTLFDHLEQSKQQESKSKQLVIKANVDGSKKQLKPCKKCGRSGTKRCSQCKSPYCSVECQQKDWIDNHHIECINIYLQNATLEDLAERFGIDLDSGSIVDSSLSKPLKSEEISVDGDQNPSSFKEAQFNNKNKKKFKNDKMEKTLSAKKFNSKQVSQRNSSSSQSSQSDLSPRKDKAYEKKTPNKVKKLPAKKQEYSRENVDKRQKPDLKKRQKSPPKSTFQKEPDYKTLNVLENSMKITSKIQLPLDKCCEVLVTNVSSCKDIYVQPIEEGNVMMTTYLITELAKIYGDSTKKMPCICSPQVGEIYACCFSADNLWYRAQILSVNESDVTVKYIDYGNIEITTCSMMRGLIPDLKEIPQQAVWCALDVFSSKTCDDINLIIKQEMKYDVPYKLKVIKTGEPYIVELYDIDGDVRKKLTNLVKSKRDQEDFSGSNTISSDDLQISMSSVHMVADLKNKSDRLKAGNKYSILPFCVNSPDDFMVQVVILDKEFHQFNQKLQSCASNCPLISQKLIQHQLVLVQKPVGSWCRAEVIQIRDTTLTVRLIDHGSIETISIQNVRALPPFCLDQPIITVRSKLAEIMPVDKQGWSPKLCSIFKETLDAMNASVRVKEQHILGEYIGPGSNQRSLWKLIDICTNTSIADLLVLDGHAILTNTELSSDDEKSLQHSKTMVSDVPKIALATGSVHNGIAIDFQSDTFFINLIQSNQKEFQTNFNEFLDAAGYLGTNYIACENEVVAAKFSVDNSWYRGQILKVHDNSMFTVFFLDYGNSECLSSNQLQPLPRSFVSYHRQAIHCKLHNACISKDGLLQFAKLVLNNECKYKIISQSNEIYNVVVYSSNGECLNEMFREEFINGYMSETESLKSNPQALCLISPPEMSASLRTPSLSSGSPGLSPPTQMTPFQSSPIPEEGLSSYESNRHQVDLTEPKLSTLGLESQADSDFVSCANKPKIKYYTKNMSSLLVEVNTCCKLHCTSVTNADVLYCQPLDDTAILQYFELLDKLGKMCNESSKRLTFLPEKGQLVAAKYLDEWYRANVVDIHEEKVEVFFIDYGNVSWVAKDQLREISLDMFVEFPILAVQCCLTGISKLKHMKEISKFQDQTMNVKVVGKVSNTYQIIFEEDLKEQLDNCKDISFSPSPSPQSAEDAEKERIQRQIEELQRKLATFN